MDVTDGKTEKVAKIGIEFSEPARAREWGTYILTYEVGEWGLNEGGGIRIFNHNMSDWGTPQFDNPKEENYTTVEAPESVNISLKIIGV